MKHSDIIKAYAALGRLSSTEIPLSISYKLFKLRKLLKPQWDFQNERVDAILSRYETKCQMDGSLKFKNAKEAQKCAGELDKTIEEINDMEIDLADIKKPIIKLDSDIRISMEDIEALSDFVIFEE